MPTNLSEFDPYQYQYLGRFLMHFDSLLEAHDQEMPLRSAYQIHFLMVFDLHNDKLNQYLRHKHERYSAVQ